MMLQNVKPLHAQTFYQVAFLLYSNLCRPTWIYLPLLKNIFQSDLQLICKSAHFHGIVELQFCLSRPILQSRCTAFQPHLFFQLPIEIISFLMHYISYKEDILKNALVLRVLAGEIYSFDLKMLPHHQSGLLSTYHKNISNSIQNHQDCFAVFNHKQIQ